MPATITRHQMTITHLPGHIPVSAFPTTSPLVFWRLRRPDQMHRKDSASVRLALSGTRMPTESRWKDAITGDSDGYAAVAIGICIRQIKQHPVDSAEVELAVSATLAYALLGDTASAIVMSWALKHRAKFDPPCALLSDLWLVSVFDLSPGS